MATEPLLSPGAAEPVVILEAPKIEGADDWTVPESVKQHPYFVEVTSTLAKALRELDERMRKKNDYHLISGKRSHMVGGKVVSAGEMAVWNRNGRPVIAIDSGNYWNLSPRHEWVGLFNLSAPVDVLGLTVAQAGQSEALVVQDPQNRVFIIRNGGFASYGNVGRFKVLALVDTLNLGADCVVMEPGTNRILGWKKEVKTSADNTSTQFTVATFFNVPANNVVILQRGNTMLLMSAGQHVLTNPNTTYRCFYSLGERQIKFKTQPAYTIEGVPVLLNVNLRYRVIDPLKLTANYDDVLQALANPAQSAVNSVVSRMSYQQFMRAQKIDPSTGAHHAPWVEAFKAECLGDLQKQAIEYGINVESFDVLDRELEGKLGKDLESQSEQVLRNQVQATQVELQNHIATEAQRGKLQIAQVEAQIQKVTADANYYTANRASDAEYYMVLNAAKARAEASRLVVEQEAKNTVALAGAKTTEINLIAEGNASVPGGHAQLMQLSLFEIEKRKALPASTVYFSGDLGEHAGLQGSLVGGFALASGIDAARVK